MDTAHLIDLIDDEDEMSCLESDVCVEQLLRDSPPGCIYCVFTDLEEGEDE